MFSAASQNVKSKYNSRNYGLCTLITYDLLDLKITCLCIESRATFAAYIKLLNRFYRITYKIFNVAYPMSKSYIRHCRAAASVEPMPLDLEHEQHGGAHIMASQ